MKDMLRR